MDVDSLSEEDDPVVKPYKVDLDQQSQLFSSLLEAAAMGGRGKRKANKRGNSQEDLSSQINKKINLQDFPPQTDKTPTNLTQELNAPVKYERGDKGPYFVMIQRDMDDKEKYTPLLTLQVCKLLDRAGMKYKSIDPVSRKAWNVNFGTMDEANRALSNKYLKEMKLKATLPMHKLFNKGTVRGIPLDMSIPELLRKINEENSVKAVNGFRLKRRQVNEDGQVEWQDTFS